jgi:DNA-directed RNA polymerase specialized sigma24 family protein
VPDSQARREAAAIAQRRQRAVERAAALFAELVVAVADMREAGYSLTEIAETIGVTKGRVQQIIHAGRRGD